MHADVRDLHARFLTRVGPGRAILDAGCGSGRDAFAFAKAGFQVTALDGSIEMVRRAARHTGLTVLHLTYDQIDWTGRFEGVWASASLLHTPRSQLPAVVARLVRALKSGGSLFASFKCGDRERQANGRHFTDMTEPMLVDLLKGAGLDDLDVWTSAETRPGRGDERWVSGIGAKLTSAPPI